MKKLLVINTIGLTGVEILASEVARLPGVSFLPGQNFIQFDSSLYRPHDYNESTAEQIFVSLNRHQYTKAGRCWAGLTKHMSSEVQQKYDVDKHKVMFVQALGQEKNTLYCLTHYAQTFLDCMGIDTTDSDYLGFWGANFVLAYSDQPHFSEQVKVINWNADIYSWLAMISNNMTWDCIEACKFWLVNNLFLAHYGNQSSGFINIDRERFLSDKESELSSIQQFMRCNAVQQDSLLSDDHLKLPIYNLGFIELNHDLVGFIRKGASDLQKIYSENIYFQVADEFGKWSKQFVNDDVNRSLLNKYQKFWNSTAHTNFDWVDPISAQIIESALQIFEYKDSKYNLSCDFYHKYSHLSSDSYEVARVSIEHYWGNLEDEIIIPKTPYHIKVVLQYLENVAGNYIKHSHSCLSLKKGHIYQRIIQPEYQQKIQQFGLTEKMEKVTAYVHEVEELIRSLRYP
jgi:hypothetical protein